MAVRRASVKFGDTIRMESTVLSTRRTSKGDRGVVRLGQEISNQRGEVVQKGVFASLMARTGPRVVPGVEGRSIVVTGAGGGLGR